MSARPKFPLQLARVERNPRTPAQDMIVARGDIESAVRFVAGAGHEDIAALLGHVVARIDALGLPDILPLGCHRCNGEVPAHDPDLTTDRLCRSCADDYDRALAGRRVAMRAARAKLKLVAPSSRVLS